MAKFIMNNIPQNKRKLRHDYINNIIIQVKFKLLWLRIR